MGFWSEVGEILGGSEWVKSGNDHLNHSDFKGAIYDFDRAIKLNPENLEAFVGRGKALYKLGRYDEALASCDKAIAINPNDTDVWAVHGKALTKLGRYAEALASCDNAIKLDPNFATPWTTKGDALKELKRYEDAIFAYDRAIQIDPKNVTAFAGKNELLTKIHSEQQQNREKEEGKTVIQRKIHSEQQQNDEKEKRETVIQRSKKTESSVVLPSPIKTNLKAHDEPTLERIIKEPELLRASEKPKLAFTFDHKNLIANRWHKIGVPISNSGNSPAFDVIVSFSDGIEVKRVKPITIEAGKSATIEVGILSKIDGTIPFEITLDYKDATGNPFKETQEFWIDVVEKGATTSPPSEIPSSPVSQSTPHTSQPPQAKGGITMRNLPPEMTEKYIESEFIGKGGFARVFKAKRRDGMYVAVKVPIDLDESTGKTFISEMQNWTKFSHPNIVKIYDYNIMPLPYFEEELCDSSLDKLKKPLDCAKAAWIIFNVCEGLKYAHARQVIHRDLKPQNILFKNGIPKISDWGLSKVVTESTSSTTTAFTPFYAAPEQVTNKPKDQRTDIWQVGIILYELVTGSLPFTGDSQFEIIANIPTTNPVPPGDRNPEAKKIEPIILRCMEKDPAKRYQSVADLQKDLAVFLKMDCKESLQMSIGAKNFRQSAEYCSKLLLANLKSGDLHEAYKYATDLVNYSEGEVRGLVKELSEQIRIRIDNDLDEVPDEIIEAADLIAHKIGVGLTTL